MRIAFFDIDGTLATGTKVPESAAAALARMRANGDLVFICTGRARAYVEANFGDYADGFVCCNGRYAFRGDETVLNASLSPEQIRSLSATLDSVDCGYAFLSKWGAHYCGNPAYRHIAYEVWGDDLHDGVDPDADEVFCFDVYFKDADHRARITEALRDTCLVNPHGPHPSADVTILGADKGDAIRHVAERLGFSDDEVFAFGDGVNDLPMIVAAGHGVAMGNAVDELKAAAEYVTTDIDDDGIKNALAHYGLI